MKRGAISAGRALTARPSLTGPVGGRRRRRRRKMRGREKALRSTKKAYFIDYRSLSLSSLSLSLFEGGGEEPTSRAFLDRKGTRVQCSAPKALLTHQP
jgi:hypothetical protein